MSHPLAAFDGKSRLRVIGLMSGTSADGIDAALVELEVAELRAGGPVHPNVIGFVTVPFSSTDKQRVLALSQTSAAILCQESFWLGELFAAAALQLTRASGVAMTTVDLISSHGQTVWHQPPSASKNGETPSTLQIGEPAVIAARTGRLTIADFRVADVAAGGEGAPLVPFTDWLQHRQAGRRLALQNIGGIANVTLLTERAEDVVAFDNGPGNMMIDAIVEQMTGGKNHYDADGNFSAQGAVQSDLLAALMADDYLRLPPPKSTGRERFGAARVSTWAREHADRRDVDLVATLVAFTAEAIADSYRRFLLPRGSIDEVKISGGGAHNRTLVAALAKALAPTPVRVFGDAASIDGKEAIAFALLGALGVLGLPGNLPSITGARGYAVLGKICAVGSAALE